jgi:HAE1 family hydrophobic/amphiphilic exporter-1
VLQTLIEGIAFTGIAMLFFLRSWRNAIVVMIAIPTSLFVTLFVMKLAELHDRHGLAARDDADHRHPGRRLDRGARKRRAPLRGRRGAAHRGDPRACRDRRRGDRDHAGRRRRVLADRVLAGSGTGRFLGEFGVVVTIATLTSLFVSFTITPALAGNWSLLSTWKPPRIIDAFSDAFARLRDFYCERILPLALRFRSPSSPSPALLTLAARSR